MTSELGNVKMKKYSDFLGDEFLQFSEFVFPQTSFIVTIFNKYDNRFMTSLFVLS